MALFIFGCIFLLIALFSVLGWRSVSKHRAAAKEDRKKRDLGELRIAIVVVCLIGLLGGFLMVFFSMWNPVSPGHIAVQKVFGGVQDGVLSEGGHFVAPWVTTEELSVRTQQYTITIAPQDAENDEPYILAISKDGADLKVDITIWYRLNPDGAATIYRDIGQNYEDVIIRPAIRTAVREAAKEYLAIEAVTDRRDELQLEIEDRFRNIILSVPTSAGIVIERINIRNIDLPDTISAAIDAKLAADQEAQMMEFKLQKERKTAEMRIIEAQGLAESQAIIDASLTPNYLTWKYISTLAELVNSPNNTVVILPFDQNLTPLIDVTP